MDWRKHAGLFINSGKFRVAHETYPHDSHPFTSIVNDEGCLMAGDTFYQDYSGYQINGWMLENCALLARPISDLTDEEVDNIVKLPDMPISKKRAYLEGGNIADVMLDLTEVGAYPFNQEDFKTNKVVDITSL